MDQDCIFCKIIKGEIPAAKVYENDDFLAFLSVAPVKAGHTLVIPKKHVDYIFDADDEILSKVLIFSRPVAKALSKTFNPKTNKVGIITAGLEIPHMHIHLIPMDQESDLDFSKAQSDISFDELNTQAKEISLNL